MLGKFIVWIEDISVSHQQHPSKRHGENSTEHVRTAGWEQ
jgi:hypothetical protein